MLLKLKHGKQKVNFDRQLDNFPRNCPSRASISGKVFQNWPKNDSWSEMNFYF